MPHVPSSAWGPPHMITKGERTSSGRMLSAARARQQQPIAPEMMPSMMDAVCGMRYASVGEDVASSGLLLDYGEVTLHAGEEWGWRW